MLAPFPSSFSTTCPWSLSLAHISAVSNETHARRAIVQLAVLGGGAEIGEVNREGLKKVVLTVEGDFHIHTVNAMTRGELPYVDLLPPTKETTAFWQSIVGYATFSVAGLVVIAGVGFAVWRLRRRSVAETRANAVKEVRKSTVMFTGNPLTEDGDGDGEPGPDQPKLWFDESAAEAAAGSNPLADDSDLEQRETRGESMASMDSWYQ